MKMNNKFLIIIGATIVETFGILFFLLYGMQNIQTMKNFQYMEARMQGHLIDTVNFVNNINNYGVVTASVYDEWEASTGLLKDDIDFLTKSKDRESLPPEFDEALDYIPDLWRSIKLSLGYIGDHFKDLQELEITDNENFYLKQMGISNAKPFLAESPNFTEIYEIWRSVSELITNFRTNALDMAEMNEESITQLSTLCIQKENQFAVTAILIAVAASIILVVFVLIITGGITKRIRIVRDFSGKLKEKDFTANIKPNGSSEMKDLMNNMNGMAGELNDFLLVVKGTAAKAIESGYRINESADSTAAATTQIDANIESITREFDQISESVAKSVDIIADMNRQVDNLVHYNNRQTQSVDDMNKTVLAVADTLTGITRMAEDRSRDAQEMHNLVADGDEKIKITAKMLDEIKNQLNEISGVVRIINDIASQTNLLSMNAAIEAAHAGDSGAGFSVVAGEIRSLAESTTANAKKIKESVGKIVDTVVNANDASVQASEAFGKVRENADQVINSMQEISNGIVHIDDQMNTIRSKTEETAVAAGEISSFCEKLADKQKNVSDEVSTMDGLFAQAQEGIHEIKKGTSDIVLRVTEVSDNSKDSYRNMTDLENILEEFKTKEQEEVSEEAGEANEAASEDAETAMVYEDETVRTDRSDEKEEIASEDMFVTENLEEI